MLSCNHASSRDVGLGYEARNRRGMLAPLDATDLVNPETSCGIARLGSTASVLLW
jgi:hypothetical protein